jgi:hypothetical protein
MRLEELELLFARLSGCYNLHHRLQLQICACPRRKHVNNWVGGWRRRWPRRSLRRGLLNGLGWWRPWLRLLFRRIRWLVVLLILWRMLAVLVVVRPCSVLLRRRRHFPRYSSVALFWRIELDGEGMRLNDQLCVQGANLREVLLNLLLPRPPRLVCIRPLRWLLWHRVLLVKGPEVDARHPDCTRPLQRGAEDAALLDVLPFRRR